MNSRITHNSPVYFWRFSLALILTSGFIFVSAGCGGGPSYTKVSGKVTYKNQPLPGGNLTFISTDKKGGNPGATDINEDGTFSLTVPSGECVVSVTTEGLKSKGFSMDMYSDPSAIKSLPGASMGLGPKGSNKSSMPPNVPPGMMPPGMTPPGMGGGPKGPLVDEETLKMIKEKGMGNGPGNPIKGKYTQIPARYSDPEKSGLKYKISGSSQTIEISLTD